MSSVVEANVEEHRKEETFTNPQILTETGIPLRDGNGDSIQASVCNKVLDVDFWSASCSCSGCWSIGADPLVPKLL